MISNCPHDPTDPNPTYFTYAVFLIVQVDRFVGMKSWCRVNDIQQQVVTNLAGRCNQGANRSR